MSMMRKEELGKIEADSNVEEIPPISMEGFNLSCKKIRKYIPTGAPVFFFDMNDNAGARIGQVHVILEPNEKGVLECGHICGSMLKSCENANLLGMAAKELERFAAEHGIDKIRYVVPLECKISIEACLVAGAIAKGEYVDSNGNKKIVLENGDYSQRT